MIVFYINLYLVFFFSFVMNGAVIFLGFNLRFHVMHDFDYFSNEMRKIVVMRKSIAFYWRNSL